MRKRNMITALISSFTVVAPLIGFLCDSITKEREMNDLADRVVQRLEERERDNVQKENKDQN